MAVDPKLYDTFAPPERLTLVLEAMARKDDVEVERLRRSCPRKTYTGPDLAFDERFDLAFDTLAIVAIDLRALSGKLHVLRWAMASVTYFSGLHHVIADLAFVDGARCAAGQSQSPFFLPKDGEEAPMKAIGGKGDEAPEPAGDDYVDRLMAVEERSERATQDVVGVLGGAARSLARELADVWAAFGRFSKTRLGVPPETLLSAWGMSSVAEGVVEMLALHPTVGPLPERVAEYCDVIGRAWDKRFGGPAVHHDGGDDDGQ